MYLCFRIMGVKPDCSIGDNGSGIAEGRDLKDKSFKLAQMPNRSTGN